jgi:hypothetical protein
MIFIDVESDDLCQNSKLRGGLIKLKKKRAKATVIIIEYPEDVEKPEKVNITIVIVKTIIKTRNNPIKGPTPCGLVLKKPPDIGNYYVFLSRVNLHYLVCHFTGESIE